MQHPPTDKVIKKRSAANQDDEFKGLNTIERYAAVKEKSFEQVRAKIGSDWFATFPIVNPHKVIEKSRTAPLFAAFMLQYGCASIARMEERNIREYMAAAYFVACDLKCDERAIAHLAREVSDGRYKNGVPVEAIKNDILHYLFLYIFFQSKIRSRDRATQYAQGLKEYFYEGRPPLEVGKIIIEYGPDRLRRVAQRKSQVMAGAQEWANKGKDPTAPSFDEVLATMLEEEKQAKATADDELPDTDGRALPPAGSDDEISEADLIAEIQAEIEAEEKSDSEDSEDEGSGVTGDEDESDVGQDDKVQHPKIDEFFLTTLQMTAQIVDGLTDDALSREKRRDLATLAMQLGNMILLHRKPYV